MPEEDKQLRRITDMGEMALSCCVLSSLNEKILIVSSWDNNIYVYSVDYGRVLDKVCGHVDAVSSLSACGTSVLSTSWDGTIKVWNLQQSGLNKSPLVEFEEHETEVRCAQFDSTGTLIVSGSNDGVVMVWDLRTGGAVAEIRAHSEPVSCVSFAGEDSSRIISTSGDQIIKLFESSGSEICFWHAQDGVSAHVTDGNVLLTAGDSGSLRLWDLREGSEIHQFNRYNKKAITSMCISTEGDTVITGSDDGEIGVWKRKQR